MLYGLVDCPRLAFRQPADPHVFRIVRCLFFSSGQFRGRLLPHGGDSRSHPAHREHLRFPDQVQPDGHPLLHPHGRGPLPCGARVQSPGRVFQVGRRHPRTAEHRDLPDRRPLCRPQRSHRGKHRGSRVTDGSGDDAAALSQRNGPGSDHGLRRSGHDHPPERPDRAPGEPR